MKLYIITQKSNINMIQGWVDWTDTSTGIVIKSIRAFTAKKHALAFIKSGGYPKDMCKIVAMEL